MIEMITIMIFRNWLKTKSKKVLIYQKRFKDEWSDAQNVEGNRLKNEHKVVKQSILLTPVNVYIEHKRDRLLVSKSTLTHLHCWA